MDNQQQQQRINAAAQQFTDALVAASRATYDRGVAAQKLGTQMTGYFFNSVMNNLRTQAEGTRQVRQQLADQQRRAQEATREFTQASTNTYMNLLDSINSFYQGGTTRAQRRAEEAERSTAEAERRVEQAEKRSSEAEERAGKAEKRAEEAQRRVEEAKGSTEQAESRAKEAERRAEEAERGSSEADSQGGDDLPLADYDSLNIRQISERLDELSVEEIERLRDYEVRNKDRSTLVNRLNSRIEVSS